MGWFATVTYMSRARPEQHFKLREHERLFNKCEPCNKITRGVVRKWPPSKDWYWHCPHCYTGKRYPK